MDLLFASGDSEIDDAIRFFETSESIAKSQVAGLEKVAPLAWNPDLAQSADSHNDLMIFFGEQSHNLPGELSLADRILVTGYDLSFAAESVFAFTDSVLYGHAGFYIDWGDGPNGIQDPAGHRDAMLSADFTEVGIAYEAYSGQGLGPFVTTQHFGRPATGFGQEPFPKIVGVVIFDDDQDLFYDIGEGLSDITVTATGGGNSYRTTTWDAGGYALTVAPDVTYEVTFSGAALGEDVTHYVHVGTRNVARDAIAAISLAAPLESNVPTMADDTIIGTVGDDIIDLLDGDDFTVASSGNDDVFGGDGIDRLNGGEGDDYLNGGAGDDTLYAGVGKDELDGGEGLDWAVFESSLEDFTFATLDGEFIINRLIEDGSDTNSVVDVEFFKFDDVLVSETQLLEMLEDGAAQVSLSDGLKNVVAGTSGSETLVGSNQSDEIFSGAGQFDELVGLAGADAFVFGDEATNGTVERDIIYDFEAGLDVLNLGDMGISDVLQTSQGIVVIREGDGDAIYVKDFDLDLADIELLLGGIV